MFYRFLYYTYREAGVARATVTHEAIESIWEDDKYNTWISLYSGRHYQVANRPLDSIVSDITNAEQGSWEPVKATNSV